MLYSDVQDLKKNAVKLKDISANKVQLNTKLNILDNILGSTKYSSSQIQQGIMDILNDSLSKGMQLREFPSPQMHTDSLINVETFRFSVEGDFISLVKALNRLESHAELGKVISSKFEVRSENQGNKRLFLSIYLQNYKQQ